ncbi:hypothetical protein JTE90_004029 [Oedothorax gibbosus]|uniref:Uncharacterized protein n=1 Tax=Oedothorax gibbosus TaxID=931172 RepID=A0AAV6U698_9ARAC|nr:hypothetical protein JTE90_004029 [Oedothorax gibbosus]
MCASQWVLNKPGGEMKVQAGGGRPHSGSPFPRGRGAPGTIPLVEGRKAGAFHLWKWRSLSAHVGTRKMVNYARTGRCQRKNWWRSVAVLTCILIVRSGSSGVRLIKPSSSWFLPKFPSG